MLDERRTVLDPVAAVRVDESAQVSDHRVVDVAADDAVDPAPQRRPDEDILEMPRAHHRVLDLLLEELRQGPVTEAKRGTKDIEQRAHPLRRAVGPVAEPCEPLPAAYDGVELVPVDDEKTPAVRVLVDRFLPDAYAPEAFPVERVHERIVVSRNVDDLHPLRHLQQSANDLVVRAQPSGAPSELPAVDDIAHEVEPFAPDRRKKRAQLLRPAPARSEVDVRKKDRSV